MPNFSDFHHDFHSHQFLVTHFPIMQGVLVRTEDGQYLMPEMYAVPADCVNAEYSNPGSQPRYE